jgi:FkbM family methyltransferase
LTDVEMGMPVPIALAAPQPVAASWLEEIARLGSVHALRDALITRYPAFTPQRLERLAIVGAAEEGRRLAELCAAAGIRVEALADDNPARQGQTIGESRVVPVDDLAGVAPGIPLVVASHRPLRLIERLRAHGFTEIALFMVLQAAYPDRFPPHMFYDAILEDLVASLDRYRQLTTMLDDETSRRHLDAILGFRQTGDIGALASVIDWDVYLPKGLFPLGDREVYVDAGAFDGDTIRLFMRRVSGRFERIVAFEPDPHTFRRLTANFAAEPRVHPVPKGLYSRSTILRFANDASRGSNLDSAGQIEVPVTTIDEVFAGERVTYVKMNIEGAELDAIRGAQSSIRKWRPRLAISAYHRPTDLWQVPFLIRDSDAGYRLHLRQHDAGIIETVAYGVA